MIRSFFVAVFAAAVLAPAGLRADSIALREIQELREAVAQQSKQIEALAQQIAKLNQTLETQKPGSPLSVPVVAPEPVSPPAAPAPEAPRAEAVPKHVVAKGETLTSIAKLYSIPIADLQKLNKIENDRKLQIGQALTLPFPTTPKPTEPTSEKKENP